MTHSSHDSSFGRNRRLLTKRDFNHVFNDAPIKHGNPAFLLLAKPSLANESRLGLVIAKKHIKTAVKRNLVKRFARETFRTQNKSTLALDMVLLARSQAVQLNRAELRKALQHVFHGASRKALSLNTDKAVLTDAHSIRKSN